MELKSSRAAGEDIEEITEIDLYGDLAAFAGEPPNEAHLDVERIVISGSAPVDETISSQDPASGSQAEPVETPITFVESAPSETARELEAGAEPLITFEESAFPVTAAELEPRVEPLMTFEGPAFAETAVATGPGLEAPTGFEEIVPWAFSASSPEAGEAPHTSESGASDETLSVSATEPGVSERATESHAEAVVLDPAADPLPAVDYALPVVDDPLPAVDYALPTVDYALPTADMLSSLDEISDKVGRAEETLSANSADPLFELAFDREPSARSKVCSACGVESGFDDLLCIACGAFLGELGDDEPNTPMCGECGLSVIPEEVFCPSCGSVVAD